MSEYLNTHIQYLHGVGPKKATMLEKELGIKTYEDILYHFPYKYIDRSKFYTISQINSDIPYIQLKGRILSFRSEGGGKGKSRLVGTFADNTGYIELIWFQGAKWVRENLKTGIEYVVFGRPTRFKNSFSIAHPEVESVETFEKSLATGMQPLYNTSEKMKSNYLNSKAIQKIIHALFTNLTHKIRETLSPEIIEKYKLIPLHEALVNIHFPANQQMLQKATFRLKFEELFYVQLNILQYKFNRLAINNGFVFEKVGDKFNSFYHNNLKFELTNAQKKVMKEIRRDLGSGKQMNRLLQGDVGSGKTLVALMTMLIGLDNNYQACLMAPTEILAAQHFETIVNFLEGLDIGVELLTGSTKKSKREQIHAGLAEGKLEIIIGTHALIEDVVKFKNLGLVIIDEQHRFGVAQRAKLWEKSELPPHVLVMTATPIPRTLAMTFYGDLDRSVIDELPPGRKPIKTIHYYDSQRLRMFGLMKEIISKGNQVYVVFPLIKESEKMDYKDLEDGYESITRAFPAPKYTTCCVHGKMKPEEKEKAMGLFARGTAQILVSTTVIEVGVDVANATVMVIESAERFGLSQLHQLRGRVGRGGDQSWCILMTSFKLTNEARKRIDTMVKSNDGFEIAEVDLKIRGPGDLEGTQQSGLPFNLKIANLVKDNQIIIYARNMANEVLSQDTELSLEKNQVLKTQLNKLKLSKVNWRNIS